MIVLVIGGALSVIMAAVIREARKKAKEHEALAMRNQENVMRLFLSPLSDLKGGGQP